MAAISTQGYLRNFTKDDFIAFKGATGASGATGQQQQQQTTGPSGPTGPGE